MTLRSPANIPKFTDACSDIGIVVKEEDKRNVGLSILVNVLADFAKKAMSTYNIIILRNKTPLPFVLASRPAIMRMIIQRHTKETQYEWTCPLSETLMLVLVDKEHAVGADGQIVDIDINTVDKYNQYAFQDKTVEQFVCTQEKALRRYQKIWDGRKIKPIKEKKNV